MDYYTFAVIIPFLFIHQHTSQMTQYDQIFAKYLAYKEHSSFCEDVEYHTFVHRLLLPALGINDVTTIDLEKVLASYRVLDLACGGGYLTSKETFLMFKLNDPLFEIPVFYVNRKTQKRTWL